MNSLVSSLTAAGSSPLAIASLFSSPSPHKTLNLYSLLSSAFPSFSSLWSFPVCLFYFLLASRTFFKTFSISPSPTMVCSSPCTCNIHSSLKSYVVRPWLPPANFLITCIEPSTTTFVCRTRPLASDNDILSCSRFLSTDSNIICRRSFGRIRESVGSFVFSLGVAASLSTFYSQSSGRKISKTVLSGNSIFSNFLWGCNHVFIRFTDPFQRMRLSVAQTTSF